MAISQIDFKKEVLKGLVATGKENQAVEVRILNTNKGTISGVYNDFDKLIEDIKPYDEHYNIYMTLNNLPKELLARGKNKLAYFARNLTKDNDIKKRNQILIDVDPVRVSGISSSNEELEAANEVAEKIKDYLIAIGFPKPIKALSGNGIHLLLTVELENNKEVSKIVKSFLETLDRLFSNEKAKVDTSVYNASRITKLYGTMAVKGDNTSDRPHRRSKIIDVPDVIDVVSESLILKVIEDNEIDESYDDHVNTSTKKQKGIDVGEWLKKYGIEVHHRKEEDNRIVYVLSNCPWCEEHTGTCASVTQFQDGAVSAKCFHDSCSEQNWRTLRNMFEPKSGGSKFSHAKGKNGDKTQSEELFEIIQAAGDKFFHNEINIGFVSYKWGDKGEMQVDIRGKKYELLLRKRYFEATKKSVGTEALKQTLSLVESFAIFDGEELQLGNRIIEKNDTIYYDLVNKNSDVVEITKDGWKIGSNSEILFTRTNSMKQQVEPVEGGNLLDLLDKYYNFQSENDKILHAITLISSFMNIEHPILCYHGEKGAGKSTTMRMDKNIVDPSVAEIMALTKKEDDLCLILNNHHTICFDNVDKIKDEISDILCQAVTGGSYSKRKNYSDYDETIYKFKKTPIIMNSIGIAANRPDLLDRVILIGLKRIEKDKRKVSKEIWQEFENDKPKIIGAIFTIISKTLDILPSVHLKEFERLAEFQKTGYAIAESIPEIKGEKFLQAFLENRGKANKEAINGNVVLEAIILLMNVNESFKGSPTQLFEVLSNIAFKEKLILSPNITTSVNVLMSKLSEVESNLNDEGIFFLSKDIVRGKLSKNTNKGRVVEIVKVDDIK